MTSLLERDLLEIYSSNVYVACDLVKRKHVVEANNAAIIVEMALWRRV